jgi:anthraniloyl-CoA monooxygenase
VKVRVLGAGPAGLYLGILLKKADPAHEVSVVDRNAPDATFGWGVVFSEETLGALRDADYPSYLEITDTFARWDAVDIAVRGRRLRCRGHTFSAIARKRLLRILQDRCRELGVELTFGVEIGDVGSFAADADVLVGADGVNSVVRRTLAERLGVSVRPQGCKYIWFGTDLVFDAFQFLFTETGHGTVQAHGYPFDERTSTFIVECPERAWHALGLDELDEAGSIEFCERLFAEHLGGHRLLSNRSTWLSFPRVRAKSWHDGNTVLLGDAAHTAHFTIGSGTKLAMEDAVALAQAFVRHGGDVPSALVDFEAERQPVVERFQQAAADSAGYFERVRHHVRLEPERFAMNLLTRSGRVGHANLAARDPEFVRVADLVFAGTPERLVPVPPLLTPFDLGELRLPNRVVTSAHADVPPGEHARARADGAGLVLSGFVAVSEDGRIHPETPVAGDGPVTADAAHAAGALAGVVLGHAGPRGATLPPRRGVDVPLPEDRSWPLVAASAVPYGPLSRTPECASAGIRARILAEFTAAASTLAEAGFDLLTLDCAHGRLLASFLSPLTNRRDDAYGGEHRLRFPLEVFIACREVWPADRPIAAARAFAKEGAALVHVEAGQTVAGGRPEYRRGYLTALSDRVRSETGVPTLVGGYLTTIDEANTVLAAGRADLCLLDLPRRRP